MAAAAGAAETVEVGCDTPAERVAVEIAPGVATSLIGDQFVRVAGRSHAANARIMKRNNSDFFIA